MGKVYKNKKGSSCRICKPWKNGRAKRNKNKVAQKIAIMEKEALEIDLKE